MFLKSAAEIRVISVISLNENKFLYFFENRKSNDSEPFLYFVILIGNFTDKYRF